MNTRLEKLRENIKKLGVDAYYFNTSDYHMSEYVPEYFKTIRYFSGFSGSLATLLVDEKKAYIFVDGRYHIQADKQCLPNDVDVVKLGTKGALEPLEFIKKNYKKIGLDGKRSSIKFVNSLKENGIKIKSEDIYSELIENRTALSNSPLFDLDIKYTGKSSKDKLEAVKYCFKGKTHIINNLESIAYLLNLRGDDIIHTPVFLSYMVIYKDDVYLFVDMDRLSTDQLEKLYLDGVVVRKYDAYYDLLREIKDETIILDPDKVNYETYSLLSENNNTFAYMRSIVEDMKAAKNEVEIQNMKLAHIYDGVSMVRFIKWLKESDKTDLTEYKASEYLNNLRLNNKAFDLSFDSIVAYNENAAQMHYSPSKEKEVKLDNAGILLVDSGGQYLEGTTDITRTIALGEVSESLKKDFTTVLKSMFNFSSAVFLKGMTGKTLDVLARVNVWKSLIDYRCGTGHGVGHVLSVHEGPPNVRYMNTTAGNENEPIVPGMIFSDEPGIYKENEYGIRCENLVLCKTKEKNEYGEFLEFETITLCPFDLDLIDENTLDSDTRKYLNEYHQKVYETLSPYLNEEEKDFLKKQTRTI